jgi:hypothetical protein
MRPAAVNGTGAHNSPYLDSSVKGRVAGQTAAALMTGEGRALTAVVSPASVWSAAGSGP